MGAGNGAPVVGRGETRWCLVERLDASWCCQTPVFCISNWSGLRKRAPPARLCRDAMKSIRRDAIHLTFDRLAGNRQFSSALLNELICCSWNVSYKCFLTVPHKRPSSIMKTVRLVYHFYTMLHYVKKYIYKGYETILAVFFLFFLFLI